jgi:hypothetical protein
MDSVHTTQIYFSKISFNIVTCYATEDAVQIVNSFIAISNLQSFIPLCHIYTEYNLTRQYSIPS